MAMDTRGINNKNEYYTNHYFASIFEENAAEMISEWRKQAKDKEIATPWAKFRDTSRHYYRVRERYQTQKNEEHSKPLIQEMAELYLNAMGYGTRQSVNTSVQDNLTIPVFHEECKKNGAPLLWVLLCVANERGEDILQSRAFGLPDDDGLDSATIVEDINDDILSQIFFAGEEAPRWVVLIGINQIALIDRNKWNEKRYLHFDLDYIFSKHEETTFQAVSVLLHKMSLCPIEGNSILDTLDENSHKHSAGVSDALKYSLRECIELLGNEVIYDMKNRQGIDFSLNPIDANELTLQCLRYMYRVLFMLFIEARPELGYAPMKSQTYVQGYSLEGLRDICEQVRAESESVSEGYYLDDTISELFRLVYEGYPKDINSYKQAIELESMHDAFTIEALKAHIFDPEYTRMITDARLRNCTMIQIIDLMSISRPSGNRERKGRISYSALGINQMGAVYEALLSYRGFLAEQDLYEVKRAGDKFNELDVGYFVSENELSNYTEEERVRYEKGDKKGQLRKYEKGTFIYRLAGREREKSASYYTPEVLTKCLVKYALKELLKDKTADEILHLTICEPAMGSAAFLNEAINQLAEAYLNKKQQELGNTISFDERFQELQKVKMFIADKNVYGVDLNPIAVELAEVSLWLNTIYKGAYVPWFGTQLVCGNSLIGARKQVYNTLRLERGRWYEIAPDRIMPGDKRKRSGVSRVYHFLLGDPGMSNYADKVIKELEPENIKKIKDWNKEFTKKWETDDIQTLLRLSDVIDDLWDKTVQLRKDVNKATSDHLNVYGYEESDDSMHTTIREKDDIYRRMYKSEHMNNAGPYARLKAAMDYWCALWFWPIDKAELLPSRQEFLFDMGLILEGGIQIVSTNHMLGQMELFQDKNGNISFVTQGTQLELDLSKTYGDLGIVCLDDLRERSERLQIANEIAVLQKFMHWELEFADLFSERGGFDLVIGNPPWLKVIWNEKDVLSELEPRFVIKNFSAKQVEIERTKILTKNAVRIYTEEYVNLTAQQNYINASQNYDVLHGLQGNLYECFLPQAFLIASRQGIFAFIHPESVFSDPKGIKIRRELIPRLRKHFRFSNANRLFQDVHTSREFGLNVFSNEKKIGFEQIVNLYAASTIEECYENNENLPVYMRNESGKRNIHGQRSRIIFISPAELKLFAHILDNSKDWMTARLLNLHVEQLLDILKCFDRQEVVLADLKNSVFTSLLWDETNAQKNDIIERNVHFGTPENTILSGAHIGIANPLFNCSNCNCTGNNDNTSVDLKSISIDYIQRTNYLPKGEISEYSKRIPETPWGTKYTDHYRIVARKMIDIEGERTLMSALVPKKVGHTNGLIGFAFKDNFTMAVFLGTFSSLPFDFFIKICGKGNLYMNTAGMLPMVDIKNPIVQEIVCRALLLNCLNIYYEDLWMELFRVEFTQMRWGKKDFRLDNNAFTHLSKDWNINTPLKSEFLRREALIEIDVLTAMLLNMTLEQLLNIYRIQFSILQQHERDTYYDSNGRVVYVKNNSLTNVGLSRKEWEKIKNTKEGVFTQTIIDDTMPGGPIERTIEYVAPFDRCDREEDYEEVWHNFEERFRK